MAPLYRNVLFVCIASGVTVALGTKAFVVVASPRHDLVVAVAVTAVLVLLLVAAVGTLRLRGIARNVDTMTRVTQAIARGEYHQRIDMARQTAWVPLSIALNTLAEQLSERETLRAENDGIAAELNEALLCARDVALESSRVKSEFLANMSHEIRTPMTAVLGFADLLLDPGLCAADRLSHVLTIRRNGEHLLAVLNDILDISKIEAGRMDVESVACSPNRILIDLASLMRVKASEKGLGFEVRFLTPVPRRIQSDPTRLHQILTNLVGNAIKFTASGCVRVLVSCPDPQSPEAMLQIDVDDTGVGMSPEQLARIFEPFVQADTSTTRRFGGTGLGLAICQRLAIFLGGRITVTSTQGRGSTFSLTIKTGSLDGVGMADRYEESVIPSSPGAPVLPVGTKLKGRVLLAEDGKDNQLLISTHLRRAGLDVTVVENGRLAVDAMLASQREGRAFAVVFMDMQMPELDGYGAAAELRSRGCAVPIVALTAHAMAGDRERCINAGCTDYLTKPIMADRLLAAAGRYVNPVPATPAPVPVVLAPVPVVPVEPVAETPAAPAVAAPVGPSGSALQPLRSDFANDPDMEDLVAMFCTDLDDRIQAFHDAVGRDDRVRVRALAHQLRGAAGGFGYPTITDAAGEVERLCSAANDAALDAPPVRAALETLVTLCRRAAAAAPGSVAVQRAV